MNYKAIGGSVEYVDVGDGYYAGDDRVENERKAGKERAYVSYGYYSAHDAMMKSASEAFIAGMDNVAFYLRDQAKILLEKSNEPWGN